MHPPLISKIIVRKLVGSLVMLLVTVAHAVPETQFQPAFEQFQLATKGHDDAIEKSADAFAALLDIEPGNPVLMAYAGASISLKAKTTWLPWKKMHYAEEGLAMLDKALALLTPTHNAMLQHGTPVALTVRFVAANTFLAVPGFMNRHERGAKLLAEVLASPLLAQSPAGFQNAVRLRAAQLKGQTS